VIFVERLIRGDLEAVWEKTQDPKQHERWDLRFSTIDYVPMGEDKVQRFTYTTRLGFGLKISGWGESVGTKLEDGKRTSALKFGSDQRTSLIEEGSGYWQYEQEGDLVRFHTVYDYRVRFGGLGRVVDSIMFRPLIAWATALSFDRMGLWIERGLDPEATFRTWVIFRASSLALAFVWAYHALVPKLLSREAELAPLLEWGIPPVAADPMLNASIVIECLMGLAFLFLSKQVWPWIITLVAMPLLAVGAVLQEPSRAIAPFNPITLNLAVACLAFVGLMARKDAPSASNCQFSSRWRSR
jgi:hypothetical protein